MARRKKPNSCQCGQPARRGNGTQQCAKCYAKAGRPKATCTRCKESFAADTLVGRRCRPCISEAAHAVRVQKVYGLEPGEYELLLAYQDGKCAICGNRPRSKRLAVDHDHQTGAVRGLLCRSDNYKVLGGVRDSIEHLEAAIRYLQNPPARAALGRDAKPS